MVLWIMGHRRQFKRFSHRGGGELIVRDRAGRPDRRKVIIRSVSERGLGAHLLGEAAEPLASGTRVLVRLPGFGGLLELPGKIAWSDRRGEPPTFGRIGIVLFVDIVPAATRGLYRAWLTDIASRHQETPELDAGETARAAAPALRPESSTRPRSRALPEALRNARQRRVLRLLAAR